MKITKEKLRQIIKEELSELMAEQELEEEFLEEDELEEAKATIKNPDREGEDLGDEPKSDNRGPNKSRRARGEITKASLKKPPKGFHGAMGGEAGKYLGHS